jgi:hypothetical protein
VKYRKLGSSDLGHAPVTEPTPAPFARHGVRHR